MPTIKTVNTELAKRASHETTLKDAMSNASLNLSLDKSGLIKTHQLKDEENQQMVQLPQVKSVKTSTSHELNILSDLMVKAINVSAGIENTNTEAKADIIIDDTVIVADVPVTVLMPLKKQIAKLLPVLNSIKVLDKATQWIEAKGQDYDDVYVTAHPISTDQTVVSKSWKEISPATQHHAAQLKEVEVKEVIGLYTTTAFSGNMHQSDKTALISRLTVMITAIESAIQSANSNTKLKPLDIGEELLNYIFKG